MTDDEIEAIHTIYDRGYTVTAANDIPKLLDEIKRLRGALYTVMGACDAECAACGAYYVAKQALDGVKEKP